MAPGHVAMALLLRVQLAASVALPQGGVRRFADSLDRPRLTLKSGRAYISTRV